MTSSEQITILLADEDALRRDGLAAVLRGTPDFNVVAQCADGEEALARIRELRPAVAVVDLNLPKLHGIELVRRVRSEALGTRIVILSGSSGRRHYPRSGAGGRRCLSAQERSARHLVDAISYVRDGGQYFSPQLGRDGLDRRILEEPPRPREREPQETAGRDEGDYADSREFRATRVRKYRAAPQPSAAPVPSVSASAFARTYTRATSWSAITKFSK